MHSRITARFLVGLADFAFAVCVCMLLIAAPVPHAYAYVDPSVMTYTIQALAGVAVALSAVIGVVWRRVRRYLLRMLRIDEDAGKKKDGVVHELDVAASGYQAARRQADEHASIMKTALGKEEPEHLLWGARFFFALSVSIMLCFTIMVASPLEIVASSGLSLFFTVNDVWLPLVLVASGTALVLALILSLVRGRAFGICLAIVAAIGIAAYIQAMFLNSALPPADGSHVVWDDYTTITVVSSLIWIVLIAVAILLSFKKSLMFKGVATATCMVCIVAQGIALGLLLATPNTGDLKPVDAKPTVTMQGMLDVSSKDNVILIVLDTYDVKYLQQALSEDSSALDEFTGFTCFMNTAGSMIPTRFAMSNILTGRSLDDDDPAFSNELIASWYTEHNMLDDIIAEDYQVDIYATDIFDAIGALSERAENIRSIKREVDPLAAVGVLLKCSLYRSLPWALKPPFWFYTDEINDAVLLDQQDDLASQTWNIDDAGYYQLLVDQGLSVKNVGKKGSFRVLHFLGAHYPFFMDRNAQRTEEETTQLEQCLGSLHMVSEYLEQLKELGVYDDATIIVTADHGEWYLTEDIVRTATPILLVKPSENGEQASRPVTFSNAPTGHLDLAATILQAVGSDAASAYGGMNILEVPDEERVRYYNATSVLVDEGNSYDAIKQWKIDGDSLDWDNWSQTGKVWPIE